MAHSNFPQPFLWKNKYFTAKSKLRVLNCHTIFPSSKIQNLRDKNGHKNQTEHDKRFQKWPKMTRSNSRKK